MGILISIEITTIVIILISFLLLILSYLITQPVGIFVIVFSCLEKLLVVLLDYIQELSLKPDLVF